MLDKVNTAAPTAPDTKAPDYKPADTTENEEQSKQEAKDKQVTPESLTVENFLKDAKTNFVDIQKIGAVFNKWTTNDRFKNVPTIYVKGSNPALEALLKQIETQKSLPFPLQADIFVQKFSEYNEERRSDAVKGLKAVKIDVSTFTIPAGQDATTYITKELQDPNSDFAKKQIKQFSIDGYREYADLLTQYPDIATGWTDQLEVATMTTLLADNTTEKIIAKITDSAIKNYNEKNTNSQLANIIVAVQDALTKNPGLAQSQDFKDLTTALTGGNMKEFQKLVYFKWQNYSGKYGEKRNDGKLGQETKTNTDTYLTHLISQAWAKWAINVTSITPKGTWVAADNIA